MFIGIYFTLGINFFFLVFLHFFWLPWGRILPAPVLQQRRRDFEMAPQLGGS